MKLLIFDIDGTLTDTIGVDNECYLNAFEDEFSIKLKDIAWENFKNVTDLGVFYELFESYFGQKPKTSQLKSFQARFFSNLETKLNSNPERFRGIDGAKEFVDYCLEKDDIKAAFATGGWECSAKLKLKAAKIPFANLPLGSSDQFISRREILKFTISESIRENNSNRFDEIVYFGDGVWDLKTTSGLQIPFIGVDAKNDGKLKDIGVEKIIHNFLDVNAIFNFAF